MASLPPPLSARQVVSSSECGRIDEESSRRRRSWNVFLELPGERRHAANHKSACFGTADKRLDKESAGLLPAQVQALPKVHVVMRFCHIPRTQSDPQHPKIKVKVPAG